MEAKKYQVLEVLCAAPKNRCQEKPRRNSCHSNPSIRSLYYLGAQNEQSCRQTKNWAFLSHFPSGHV